MPKIVTPRARAAEAAWLKYRDEYIRQNALRPLRASRQLRRREFIAGYLAAKREDDPERGAE